LVLGDESAREVEGTAGHVGVHVHAAGKHQHAGRVDGAARAVVRCRAGRDAAVVVDVDVLDDAIDAVAGS
jgi:hypothetical protein